MMTINIYDYDNNIESVNLPIDSVDEIKEINVHIISGDETGSIVFKDPKKQTIWFDAYPSSCYANYDDGSYTVYDPELIAQWINFSPNDSVTTFTYSYARMDWYWAQKKKLSEVAQPMMSSVAAEPTNTSFEAGTVAWLIEKLKDFPADAKVETEFITNDDSLTSVLGGLDDIFETSEHTVVLQSIV